jgi:Pectate lyase superfamily protein
LSFTVPPDSRAVGNPGHTTDHNDIADVLAGLGAGLNVQNTALGGGADPTGAADSTAAFQAALNAVAASAYGGRIRIPAGNYKITSALAYSGTAPLAITGDGPQATQLHLANTSTSVTGLSITQTGSWGSQSGNDGTVIVDDLSFYSDHWPGAFADTDIGLYLSGVNYGAVRNCGFYQGSASQRLNQGIVASACNQLLIDNANLYTAVNGIAFTGECQVCEVTNTSVWQPAGTGVATAASILFQGQTLGVNLRHVICHDGDRGILWTQDSVPQQPHIFFAYDLELNNHSITAAEFDYGVHVYLNDCIFSGAAVAANVPGLSFGSNFQGDATVVACKFIGQPGHSIAIGAGTGYTITGCVFGGGSGYKFASDTYDEINIAGGSEITISDCHFNVNANAGLGSGSAPRSAVWVASGVTEVTLSNSKGPGSGYGTAPVVDNGTAGIVMKRGNIGLGLADTTTGTGSTVTTATIAALSASITVPAYDPVPQKLYVFRAWGHGTQATGTAQNLNLQGKFGSGSLGTWTPGTNPAAGAAFTWEYEAKIYWSATGSSGTIITSEKFLWNGAASQHSNSAGITVSSQSAQALVLNAEWAATTGSPTITCDGTSLEPFQNYPAS